MRSDFDWPSSKTELADLIESMVGLAGADQAEDGDVDKFENEPFDDSELEGWRQRILREIWHLQFPSEGSYADRIAQDRVSRIAGRLRNDEDA